MAGVFGDGVQRRVELNILSSPANLAQARRTIEVFAQHCGFDETSRGEIGLVVNEALANVMRHAYGNVQDKPIALVARCEGMDLTISIRDWGCGVNPLELPQRPPDPLRPGGLGIVCMRQLMDDLSFVPQDDGMLLVMSRRRDRIIRPCADAG